MIVVIFKEQRYISVQPFINLIDMFPYLIFSLKKRYRGELSASQ